MELSLIVAVDGAFGIGRDNKLPWPHNSEDMKHFRKITKGKTVIMGRKTFASIGKPLVKRNNIVISRSRLRIHGVDIATTVDDALKIASIFDKEAVVIGGQQIYKLFLPLVKTLHITIFNDEYNCDAFFPSFSIDGGVLTFDKSGDKFKQESLRSLQDINFYTFKRI